MREAVIGMSEDDLPTTSPLVLAGLVFSAGRDRGCRDRLLMPRDGER